MRKIVLLFLCLLTLGVQAQTRDKWLTVTVNAQTGENLQGQLVVVTQTDYDISYGTLKLDAEGKCSVKVYEGNHNVSVKRQGYDDASADFCVAEDMEVSLTLKEKVRTPFSLTASVTHDVFSAQNDIHLSWNKEGAVFFDDFESYTPFAISFAPWTGIDNDRESAAALIGDYPNRGGMQYAQIINPLAVEPTWWYEYEVLRPYAGKQYVGFTRTMTGNANDDWLITPALTLGNENVLSFMAKASDKYPERFQVYMTTIVDNPKVSDFRQISPSNYESVDVTRWHEMTYDLSEYAGQTVRLAIRYIGSYNMYGSFMLMVDDVFVGQRKQTEANPNEQFSIMLDGTEVASTHECNYTIENVPAGHHTLGVKARYIAAETDVVTIDVDINADDYADVLFKATAESILSPSGTALNIMNKTTAENVCGEISDDCQLHIPSLPKGEYLITSPEGAYEALSMNISVEADSEVDIVFSDRILAPYNITVDTEENAEGTVDAVVKWNQELSFTDSFEDYDDFATGEFGGWLTKDIDQQPVYPIGLGSAQNIVSFPGSGTASNPSPVAPLVFNPWKTNPAMLPTDKAMAPPTGEKMIVFFSPQRARADKWLISPEMDIREGFKVQFTAKAYSSFYPESMSICVGTDTDEDDFVEVAAIDELSSDQWMRYEADLSGFAGQTVRVALHYTSYDAFFAQVDDVTIGSDGETMTIDFGNVVDYDVSLDGEAYAKTTQPTICITDVSAGTHTVGVKANYQSGASEEAFYTFSVATGIKTVNCDKSHENVAYDLAGRRVGKLTKGVYIVNQKVISIK